MLEWGDNWDMSAIIVVKIDLVNNVMEHEPANMGWSTMTNGELTSCGVYMNIGNYTFNQ